MQKRQTKKLYIPALVIVFAVLLLLVLISISTFQNLNRDRTKAMNAVHRKGLSLIYSIEAGARAVLAHQSPSKQPIENLLVEKLLMETSKIDGIAYIFLIDSKGNLICNTTPPPYDISEFKSFARLNTMEDLSVIHHIKNLSDHSHIYEVGKRFTPFTKPWPVQQQDHTIQSKNPAVPGLDPSAIIVMGIYMKDFEEARKMDFHHAVYMVAIVVALGASAIFFMFVIRNYHQVNRTLQQVQDYTRLVVDNMANGLLSINTDGKVVSFNRLTLELLGLDEKKISNMDLSVIIDFRESGISDTLLNNETILEREISYQKSDGTVMPLSLSVTPILDDSGNCKSAVILLRDLREIKQLEQEIRRSEKLAAIGELAASVAHEIRNPLSSIRGFSQFLKNALTGKPKEQEYANIMVREIDRINKVVTDLLTFARPMKAEFKPTNIQELIDRSVFLIQADADKYNISICKNVPPELPEMNIDPDLMTQALLNLTLNAIQMMKNGGSLEIGCALEDDESSLLIWVQDDGPGIKSELINKIFNPFVTTRDKGTGLGLSIVRKIVEYHNGEINVESPVRQNEKGCRFTIEVKS